MIVGIRNRWLWSGIREVKSTDNGQRKNNDWTGKGNKTAKPRLGHFYLRTLLLMPRARTE